MKYLQNGLFLDQFIEKVLFHVESFMGLNMLKWFGSVRSRREFVPKSFSSEVN